MNRDIIEGNWKEFKGKVKAQWGMLTDNRLDVIDGKSEQLKGRFQKAFGIAKDQGRKQAKDFQTRNFEDIRRN